MTNEPPIQNPLQEEGHDTARVVPAKVGIGYVVEIHRANGPIERVTGFATEAEAQAHADTINGGPAVD